MTLASVGTLWPHLSNDFVRDVGHTFGRIFSRRTFGDHRKTIPEHFAEYVRDFSEKTFSDLRRTLSETFGDNFGDFRRPASEILGEYFGDFRRQVSEILAEYFGCFGEIVSEDLGYSFGCFGEIVSELLGLSEALGANRNESLPSQAILGEHSRGFSETISETFGDQFRRPRRICRILGLPKGFSRECQRDSVVIDKGI